MVTRDPASGGSDDSTRAMTTGGSGTSGSAYDRSGGTVTGTTGTSGTSTPGMAGATGDATTTYSPHGAGSGALDETQVSGSTGGTTSGSMTDKASEMAGTAKDKAADMAGTAKDKASELTGAAREKLSGTTETIDAQRDTVAGGLDSVATQLRDRAETIPGGEKTTQLAQTAADKIETASGYLRETEVSDMMTDVEGFVRSHPTESLVIALAAGFLLGRAIKS
jgi:ElaB/YqjD/DUF883 family membrane-anchored ribosome-binding protein